MVAYRGARPNRAVQLRNLELELAECGHRTAAQTPLRNPLGHPERASAPPPSGSLPAYSLPPPGNPLQHKILYAWQPPTDNSLCHLRHTTPFAWGFIYNTTWLS